MSDKDGIELSSRFAYRTNLLDFCGPSGKSSILFDYAIGRTDKKDLVRNYLERFEGILPYYSAIAKKNSLKPFDYDVAEAYWIGNRLLEKFKRENMCRLVAELQKRGLPSSIAANLIKNMPNGLLPHHSFNVFYIGVGRLTGAVKTTLQNMDKCRISCGVVRAVRENSLVVKYMPLRMENKKLTFGSHRSKRVQCSRLFLPKIDTNSVVAIHWDFASMVLSERQKENLEHYTLHNMNCLNRA